MTIFNEVATDYDQWYKTKLGRFADDVETACAFELFSPEQGQFLPPDTAEPQISLETERHFSTNSRGGFICLLWEKPLI